jgi:hypothetical protein
MHIGNSWVEPGNQQACKLGLLFRSENNEFLSETRLTDGKAHPIAGA